MNVGTTDGKIFTSKFYPPDESWTRKNAWWIQIPVDRLKTDNFSHIHLLCQTSPNKNDFHYLKVPAEYFLKHLSEFKFIGKGKINLFLSAESNNLFEDERGTGRVNFDLFLIK